MSVVTNKMLDQMRQMDARIDAAEMAKRQTPNKSPIEKSIAEGVRIAQHLQEESARMVATYDDFLEKTLRTILDALGCAPEDLERLIRKDVFFYGGNLVTMETITCKGVPIMKIERVMLSQTEFQFIATPLEEDELLEAPQE